MLAPEVTLRRVQMLQVYRVRPSRGSPPTLEPVVDVAAPQMAPGYSRATADRLAAQAVGGVAETRLIETLGPSGDLLHAAAVIRSKDGRATGVVVATDYLTGEVAMRSRRMTEAFESYNQLRVRRRPLTGLYLSFFLMITLLILFSATWMGSYLAKRIVRPVLMLSAAAREIGAGRLDQRVEPQSSDEFGALVDAFNAMAGELATSRRKIDRSTIELERKHLEVEKRRRYVETILERIATGVVSMNAEGTVTTINSAAARLLSLPRTIVGQRGRCLRPAGSPGLAHCFGGTEWRGEPPRGRCRDCEPPAAGVATPLLRDSGGVGSVSCSVRRVPTHCAQKVAAKQNRRDVRTIGVH